MAEQLKKTISVRKDEQFPTCSVCKKVEINRGSGDWQKIPENVYQFLGEQHELSHGYCPHCYENVRQQVNIDLGSQTQGKRQY